MPKEAKVETKVKQRSPEELRQFMALAMARFQQAVEAESEWRKEGLEDLKFSIGEHWDNDIKTKREKAGRPSLTINRIGQAVKQVNNNQRQQRPAIQVNPAGMGSTKEVADVLQGMVRHIEVQSDAEVVDDVAFDYLCRTGKGFSRLLTRYVDDDGESTDQEIYIEAIMNPFMVYSDPNTRMPDRSDARFRFLIEDLSHDEYKEQYGNTELAKYSAEQLSSVGDSQPGWADSKTIRIAEYYYVKNEQAQGKARKYWKKSVHWAKINAIEPIEEKEIVFEFIPIIEVVGDDLIVDGKRYTAGLVRDGKGPNLFYDYMVSAAAETLALQPKAPFIGWKGQFTDPKWETANQDNWAYLEADVVNVEGLPNPSLPQRSQASADISANVAMLKIGENDIKATTGLYDASLGEKGPDQSGKAILQRKQQGDNATFNFTDNLVRGIRFRGKLIVGAIRKVYDAARVQRIINPDNSVDHVGIYSSQHPEMANADPETLKEQLAVKKIYDVGVGKYDITVSVGPSFQTKRQEAVATQLELMKSVPIVQQAAPDVVIRNMDIPGSDVIADRVKKLLPPQLQDNEEGSPEAELEQTKAKAAQMEQQLQVTSQALQQAHQIIETKKVEQDAKTQQIQIQETSKQAIVKMQEATKMAVAQMNSSKDANESIAQRELAEYKILHDGAHDVAMAAAGHNRAKELAAQSHQQNLEAGEQGHAQALEQGQQSAEQQQAAAEQEAERQAALNPPAESESQ